MLNSFWVEIMKSILLSFVTCLLFQSITAQVIWSEDFNSLADGTTTGPGSSWTSSCPGCLSGDYFEVRSGIFEARDVNAFTTWQTESIDISGCINIDFSLTAAETGDHEGPGCGCGINIDYFDVSYSINGGAFTVIEDWNGDGEPGHTLTGDSQNGVNTDADWGSTTITQSGLSGSTLVIRVQLRNTAASEVMRIDNVTVTCNTGLPVSLLTFEGQQEGSGNLISWVTASEENNDYFELERSVDAENFESIATIAGNGTTTEIKEYEFFDRTPVTDGYYRLKQVDYDGKTSHSEVIYLSRKQNITEPYPNPFSDNLVVSLDETAELKVIRVDGSVVLSREYPAGNHNIGDLLKTEKQGLLILKISDTDSSRVYRIFKSN